jgi:hypothetical protein
MADWGRNIVLKSLKNFIVKSVKSNTWGWPIEAETCSVFENFIVKSVENINSINKQF